MSYSTALTTETFNILVDHLVRSDGQEDVCFALWRPSTGGNRVSAIIAEPMLPLEGERLVHGNASFLPGYMDRALELALREGTGLALLHSHPSPGWQGMSRDDVLAEHGNAGQVLAATGLPLVGLTIGSDGALSGRFWDRIGSRRYERRWCETVRVVGEQLRVTFHKDQRPSPPAAASQLRTISAWGPEIQANLARLRVGIIGAGSVGSLVGEALARTGIQHIRVLDFDAVEEHNLDRLVHATRRDIGSAKVKVLVRALRDSATAEDPTVEAFECSVCEESGFKAALDCDVLFSCVDRPWPRKVLNVAAYAHLIPVIDGGIRAETSSGRLARADWTTLTAAPGRICLECSGQFDPADVMLERAGSLDDPEYIKGLPEGHHLRRRENVFAFSASLASFEVMQMLAMAIAPHGISNPGVQTYHSVDGSLDQHWPTCEHSCRYSSEHLGKGDVVEAGTVDLHEKAAQARLERSGRSRRRPWWLRVIRPHA